MSDLKIKVPMLDLKPENEPLARGLEAAISAVVNQQSFILGAELEQFEADAAAYCGTRHAIGVSSGTDALTVAMMAMGLGPGDQVITTPYADFGTLGSIVRLGATPILVDIEPDSFNLDPAKVTAVITDRTRAILPAHRFGHMAEMRRLNRLAREHELLVIEDAAQAMGAQQNGRPAGCFGHIACLSFNPSRNLGGFGDGGMLLTDDAEYAQICRQLRNHGSDMQGGHPRVGGNFRLDTVQAAVLKVKLGHLNEWNELRRQNAALYGEYFTAAGLSRDAAQLESGLEGGILLPSERLGNRHVYNQFVIYCDQRDALMQHLQSDGIGCEIYCPRALHQQECLRLLGYWKGDFPHAERAAALGLALPVFPSLSKACIEQVVDVTAAFLNEYSKRV